MITFIYGLKCPRDNCIRYVGKTMNPGKRYQEHISRSLKGKGNKKVSKWINSLNQSGIKPDLIILSESKNDNWIKEERKYILMYSKTIFNSRRGGEPWTISQSKSHWTKNKSYSKESRSNMSKAGKLRACASKETRDKLSKSLTGKVQTELHKWNVRYNNSHIYHEYDLNGIYIAAHLGFRSAGITNTKKVKSLSIGMMVIRTRKIVYIVTRNKNVKMPNFINTKIGLNGF